MTNSAKDKGDLGEREVQEIVRRELALPHARRALGAGRKDDVGDIDNVPNTVIQVARTKVPYLTAVIRKKVVDVENQRHNARVRFAASFIRWDRGPWIIVMTPRQFGRLWKMAQIGVASTRKQQQGKLSSRGND